MGMINKVRRSICQWHPINDIRLPNIRAGRVKIEIQPPFAIVTSATKVDGHLIIQGLHW
jgi:hypothetical protein